MFLISSSDFYVLVIMVFLFLLPQHHGYQTTILGVPGDGIRLDPDMD